MATQLTPSMLAMRLRVTRRNAVYCFGSCGHRFKTYELRRFCTLTIQCKDELGPLCPDCYAAHRAAAHDEPTRESELQ